MDAQLKRGLIEVCVLSVINRQDSYGYQIIEDMKPCTDISESTLYPILRRLESGGMLETYSVEFGGRLRKYYKILPAGKRRLAEFENDWLEMVRIHSFIAEGNKCE